MMVLKRNTGFKLKSELFYQQSRGKSWLNSCLIFGCASGPMTGAVEVTKNCSVNDSKNKKPLRRLKIILSVLSIFEL